MDRAVRSLCNNPSTLWVDPTEVQSAPCNKLQPLARGQIVHLIVLDHPLSTIHCDEMYQNNEQRLKFWNGTLRVHGTVQRNGQI
jgi:hypothetical protein